MLNNIPKENNKVFQTPTHGIRNTFMELRNRTAKKLNNPKLLQIHLHTFRHWKGTMEYHETKSIMHVKQILGHKSINSTMIYIVIEAAIFHQINDKWICEVAHNEQEEKDLINAGFEHVNNRAELSFYRKRK